MTTESVETVRVDLLHFCTGDLSKFGDFEKGSLKFKQLPLGIYISFFFVGQLVKLTDKHSNKRQCLLFIIAITRISNNFSFKSSFHYKYLIVHIKKKNIIHLRMNLNVFLLHSIVQFYTFLFMNSNCKLFCFSSLSLIFLIKFYFFFAIIHTWINP